MNIEHTIEIKSTCVCVLIHFIHEFWNFESISKAANQHISGSVCSSDNFIIETSTTTTTKKNETNYKLQTQYTHNSIEATIKMNKYIYNIYSIQYTHLNVKHSGIVAMDDWSRSVS